MRTVSRNRILHFEDLARFLRKDHAAIYRMVRLGKLPARRVGRKGVVMTSAGVRAWLDAPVIEALSTRGVLPAAVEPVVCDSLNAADW